MQLPIEWLPASGMPEQPIVLLHGAGAEATALAPLAQALRAEFPQSAVLAPDAPQAWDGGAGPANARQWKRNHIPARTWAAALGAVAQLPPTIGHS